MYLPMSMVQNLNFQRSFVPPKEEKTFIKRRNLENAILKVPPLTTVYYLHPNSQMPEIATQL